MAKGHLYRDQNTGATRRISGRAPGYPWSRFDPGSKAGDDQVVDQADDTTDTTPAPEFVADDTTTTETEQAAPAKASTRKGRTK